MSDVVRDLVVSLSLDAGEFTRNMRAINASIKEAESTFKLAGAGVDKFGSSLGGQLAKAQMLERTQMLQSAAVQQYTAHLSEANNKMLATEGYLAKYSSRLAAAKAQMAPLNAEIARQHAEAQRTNAVFMRADAAYQQNINSINSLQQSMISLEQEIAATDMMYQHSFNTLGAGDDQTEAYRVKLVSLNAELTKQRAQMASLQAMTKLLANTRMTAANRASRAAQAEQTLLRQKATLEAEITKLTGQVKEETQALENNRTAVVRAQAELNNAKARLKETEAELKAVQKQIALMSSVWTQAGAALTAFSQKCASLGRTMQRTGRSMMRYLTTPVMGLATASAKALISYDKAFANVRRTVSATEEQFSEFYDEIEQMSTVVATSADAIAEVVATAGQLGIHTENIMDFTRAMVDLSVAATDLESNEAATQLAKFANITGMSHDQFTNLSSTIVALGINYATTESEIVEMSKRLAAAGKQVGLSEAQIVGFAAALSSVGLEAQMGGSTFSKALVKMEVAAATGGEALTDFANVCGMTEDEFVRMWEADPAEVFQRFIVGLAKLGDEGVSAIATLQEIGISEIRLRDTMLRATNATELFASTQKTAIQAWNENTMLAESAAKKYDTLAAKLTNLKNKALVAGRQIGRDLSPALESLMGKANGLIEKFMGLDASKRQSIERWAAVAAAMGPVILIAGTLIKNLGYITGAVGKVFTAFGKLSAAVTMAGGGIKGFGSVLVHSRGFMLTLTAAAIAGGIALYDYASGAKAARDALEQLNDTATEWKNNAAETFYSSSRGLEAFGVSVSDFSTETGSALQWINGLTTEWADDTIESQETIDKYVASFKGLTANTREALSGLADTAAQAGFTAMNAQLKQDMAELDSLDARVEELLTKRREYFLTDEDKAELNALLLKRQEIEIRYRLSEADESGFAQLDAGIDAAIARARAKGGEAGVDLYKDALVAGAQGMREINKALDEQYDSRYALVQLMQDESEREAAMAELNAWYNAERLSAGVEYARVMGRALNPVINSEDIQNTYAQMSELATLLTQYSRGDAAVTDLNAFVKGLDESSITELYGIIAQIHSLKEQGLRTEEITSLTGVDSSYLENAYTQLEAISSLLESMNADTNLDSLRSMFSGSLTEEVLKIATDLDMSGAREAWAAFAKDPGADVLTGAIVTSYREKDGGADKSAVGNPGGFYAIVEAYAKANGFDGSFDNPQNLLAMISAYAKQQGFSGVFENPKDLYAGVKAYAKQTGFSGSFENPSDLLALVTAYAKAEGFNADFASPGGLAALVVAYARERGFDASFDGPNGLYAFISGYMKENGFSAGFDSPSGIMALVSAYAKAAGFQADFDSPSGLLAMISAYAKAEGFSGSFDQPKDLLALVKAYTKAVGFDADFDSPSGIMAMVAAYLKAEGFNSYFDSPQNLLAQVKAYARQEGFDPNFDEPTELLAWVSRYAKALGFNGSFDSPSGIMAMVAAYAKATGFNGSFEQPEDLLALVSAYAKAQGFVSDFTSPSGLLASVSAYAKAQGFNGDFTGPEGLLAIVAAYIEQEGGASTKELQPTVSAEVGLNDLNDELLRQWKAVNGPKVRLSTTVKASVGLTFAENWAERLKGLYDAGMLEVYGPDGLKLPVTPDVLSQLNASSLIVGVDEAGVYHVTVKPAWADATDDDAREAARALNEGAQETHGFGWGIKDADSLSGMIQSMIKHYQGTAANLRGDNTINSIAGWLGENIFNPIGLSRSRITAAYISEDQAQSYSDAILTIVDAMKNGVEVDDAMLALVQDAQALFSVMDEVRELGDDPQNYDLVSAIRNGLMLEGINVTDTTVDEALKQIIQDYTIARALQDEMFSGMYDLSKITDRDAQAEFASLYMKQLGGLDQLTEAELQRYSELFTQYLPLKDQAGEAGEEVGSAMSEGMNAGMAQTDVSGSAAGKVDEADAAMRESAQINSPAKRFIPIGAAISEGLAAGITSGTSQVTGAIVALANAAVAAAKDALQIHSPSRVFRDEIGAMAMAGFGEGVIAQTEAEGRVIRNAARYLTEEAGSAAMSGRNTYTTNNYTTDAPISFEGATFAIREEQDIHSLAQEIASLIKREQAGKGFRR